MRRWIAACAALLLAGCVTPPEEVSTKPAPGVTRPSEPLPGEAPDRVTRIEPAPEPVPEPPARAGFDDVERLLVYFEYARKLPPADLSREGENARSAYNRTRSDFDRMRLAMLLSIPNTPIADEQRAYDLLDPMVKTPASPLHGLALLMSTHLQERRRLESGLQQLQQNVQGLQNKLDALMSLERTLIDRDKGAPPRKR